MEGSGDKDLSSDPLSGSHFGSAGASDSFSGFESDQRLLNEEQVKVIPEVVKPFNVDIVLDEKVDHGKIYDLLYVKEERNFILATFKGVCVMHMNLKTGSLSERYFLPTRCKTYTIYRGKANDGENSTRSQKGFNNDSNDLGSNETSISSIPKQLRVDSSTFFIGLQRGSIAKFTTRGAKKESYIRFMREIYVGFGPIVKICEAPDKSILAFSSSGCVSRINDDSADTGRLTKDCSIFGAVVIKGENVGNSRIYMASSASVVPIYKPSSTSKTKEEEEKGGNTLDDSTKNVKSSDHNDKQETEEEEEEEAPELTKDENTNTLCSDDNVFMRVKAILGNKSAGVPSAMTGHDASIRDIIQIEVPTDDILIATASADKSIGLWHVATRVPDLSPERRNRDNASAVGLTVNKGEPHSAGALEENEKNKEKSCIEMNEEGDNNSEFKRDIFSARVPDRKLEKKEEMNACHKKLNFTPTSSYLIGLYTAHLKPVVSIAYSKRLRLLFAGSKDGTISVWYLGKAKHVNKASNDSEDFLKLDEKDKKKAEFLMYGHVGVFKLTLVERIKVDFRLKKVFVIDTGFTDVLAAICGDHLKIFEVTLNSKFSHLLSEPF